MSSMFYDPQFMLRLARMIPGPRSAIPRAVGLDARTTASRDQYGCCPACREFVRFRPSVPANNAPCPACGTSIRSVEPLGPVPGEPEARYTVCQPNELESLAHALIDFLRSFAPRRPPRDSSKGGGVWDSWLDD
jgi:hypothetical protein